ncbi:MAG: sugar ABC transporter permease [Thermomicrobiales bacterium]
MISRTEPGWKRVWRQSAPHRAGFAFILPVLVLFLLFRVWPAIDGLLLSFQDFRMRGGSTWIGFQNFRELWDDKVFWGSLRVTLTYALISVPLATIAAVAMALLIDRAIRGIAWFRAIYFLPYITSFVMVAVIWSWIYRTNDGLLNGLLDLVGIGPIPWLTSESHVLPSLAIMSVWKGVGYSMMILLAGLRAIPASLGEASAVDGASGAQTFWRITLPLLKPVLFFVIVIETIGSFQVFDAIFVMTGGGPVRASYSLVYMLYDESFKFQNYGYAAAIGVVLFLMTFTVTMVQRLMFGRGDA